MPNRTVVKMVIVYSPAFVNGTLSTYTCVCVCVCACVCVCVCVHVCVCVCVCDSV